MTATPSATDKKRIFLIDDHPIIRQGLANVLNQQATLCVCGEASDSSEALSAVERLRPDLALVDLSLRSGDGIELLKDLRVRQPRMLTLVLSMHDEALYAERALRAGARGYVMKQEKIDRLLLAISRVLAGAIYVSDQVAAHAVQRLAVGNNGTAAGAPEAAQSLDAYVERLTDRELQVFRLIGRGLGHAAHRRDATPQPQDHRKPPRAHQDQALLQGRQRADPAGNPMGARRAGFGGFIKLPAISAD